MGPLSSVNFLGEGFNKWVFPSVLFTMVFLTITNCWNRILNCIGKSQYGFDDDVTEDLTLQGKNVIDKYRKELTEKRNKTAKSPASGLSDRRGLTQVDVEK